MKAFFTKKKTRPEARGRWGLVLSVLEFRTDKHDDATEDGNIDSNSNHPDDDPYGTKFNVPEHRQQQEHPDRNQYRRQNAEDILLPEDERQKNHNDDNANEHLSRQGCQREEQLPHEPKKDHFRPSFKEIIIYNIDYTTLCQFLQDNADKSPTSLIDDFFKGFLKLTLRIFWHFH